MSAPPSPPPVLQASGGVERPVAELPPLPAPSRRAVLAGPVIAAVTFGAALWATSETGVGIRDPDGVAGRRLAGVALMVAVLVLLDVAVRAGRRTGTWRPGLDALRRVRRERWSGRRGLAMATAVASFYLSYLAYRNLKSMVPLLQPGELFDADLASLDRSLFLGNDPAALLHAVMGTGLSAEVLSVVYVFYVIFVPISLALALVYSTNLRGGIWYTTAMALNWPLGAACYLALPAVGPVFHTPQEFARLPETAASSLQAMLLDDRLAFLRDPGAAGGHNGVAAFASVHVSMVFTAAVAAHLLGLARGVRIALWGFLAGTVLATVHLGWHYLVDDVAGVGIGLVALVGATALTGVHPRRRAEP